jgi:hypothetical protein
MRKSSLVVAALAGSLLIHLGFVACGSSTSSPSSPVGGMSDAHAQGSPSGTCTSWQTAAYFSTANSANWNSGTLQSGTVLNQDTIPDGWEPYAALPMGNGSSTMPTSGTLIALRKCAQ